MAILIYQPLQRQDMRIGLADHLNLILSDLKEPYFNPD